MFSFATQSQHNRYRDYRWPSCAVAATLRPITFKVLRLCYHARSHNFLVTKIKTLLIHSYRFVS